MNMDKLLKMSDYSKELDSLLAKLVDKKKSSD